MAPPDPRWDRRMPDYKMRQTELLDAQNMTFMKQMRRYERERGMNESASTCHRVA